MTQRLDPEIQYDVVGPHVTMVPSVDGDYVCYEDYDADVQAAGWPVCRICAEELTLEKDADGWWTFVCPDCEHRVSPVGARTAKEAFDLAHSEQT